MNLVSDVDSIVAGTVRMKELRKSVRYSQQELGTYLGVSKGTIERIERAERVGTPLPTNYRVYLLATYLLTLVCKEGTKYPL